MIQITKTQISVLTTGFAAGLFVGLIAGYIIALRLQPWGVDKEIERYSYKFAGDISRLATPVSYAVDGDWLTKVEWNTTCLGDFNVYIIENFTVPNLANNLKWEFEAYHKNTGSLIPTPMTVSYWNGSSWTQLYALDDQDHVNEVFIEKLDMPAESFSDGKISIKTNIKYSSHVVGAILPNAPEQEWHYVEYFEGKMISA